MIKYLEDLIQKFKSRIAGVDANPEKWVNQPITKTDLEKDLGQLETSQKNIDKAKNSLQKEREAGRQLVDTLIIKLNQVDKLAEGIHGQEMVKLNDYGIASRKEKTTRPIPSKGRIDYIADDSDGEGFVICLVKLADADHYEIQKGVAADNSTMVLSPPYPFFKTTKKITIVDDDVEKGKRYFYRVRGINNTGAGEWSEPVSRVQ